MSYQEIIDAANDLTALLEGNKGLKHPKHAAVLSKGRARIEKVFRSFFGRQHVAVMRDVRPRINSALGAHPVKEAKSLLGRQFASTVIPDSLSPLRFVATTTERNDFDDAITDLIAGAAETLGRELAADSTISDNVATSWLRDNSLSKLTGEVNDTSKQRLRDALADAWDKGGSYNDMVKSVTDTFEDFSSVRAGMIAQTEANDAYIEGRDATARAAGLGEKRWSADGSDTCPECEEQIAAGWIDIDDDFPSGDDPPLHPNCDCGTDYRSARE